MNTTSNTRGEKVITESQIIYLGLLIYSQNQTENGCQTPY